MEINLKKLFVTTGTVALTTMIAMEGLRASSGGEGASEEETSHYEKNAKKCPDLTSESAVLAAIISKVKDKSIERNGRLEPILLAKENGVAYYLKTISRRTERFINSRENAERLIIRKHIPDEYSRDTASFFRPSIEKDATIKCEYTFAPESDPAYMGYIEIFGIPASGD